MRRRGLSAKVERQLERSDEEIRLSRAAAERNKDAFERLMATLDRHEAQTEDLRAFIRDMNRRAEKVVQEMVRRNDEINARAERRTEEIFSEVRESREEARAHREAILALIDRLPPAAAA